MFRLIAIALGPGLFITTPQIGPVPDGPMLSAYRSDSGYVSLELRWPYQGEYDGLPEIALVRYDDGEIVIQQATALEGGGQMYRRFVLKDAGQ